MMVKEGCMEEFLSLCEKLRPLVLGEKGCHGYDYTREIASPLSIQEPINSDRITLVERWESLDALRTHGEAPHMKELGSKMKDLRSSVIARVGQSVF